MTPPVIMTAAQLREAATSRISQIDTRVRELDAAISDAQSERDGLQSERADLARMTGAANTNTPVKRPRKPRASRTDAAQS